jgi:hypothetical protein
MKMRKSLIIKFLNFVLRRKSRHFEIILSFLNRVFSDFETTMSGNGDERIVNVAWGSLLNTPLARLILANTAGIPLCQIVDELLLASLQRDRGFGVPDLSPSSVVRLVTGVQALASGGQQRSVVPTVSGFQRWTRADFPQPPPTAYIPQNGVVTMVDMGILAAGPSGLVISSVQSGV